MERSFIKKSVLCLLATISLGTIVNAQTVVVDGIQYQLVNNSYAKCLGPEGDHASFTRNGLTIPAQVQIADKMYNVTSIGTSAFDGCVNITGELKLPETVKDLGFYAFQNCSGFTGTLDLSNLGARGVLQNAFTNCSGFNKLILGEVTEAVGTEAFANCTGFKGELDLSHITETIQKGAFRNCSGFTSIKMSPNTKQIYPEVFQNCTGLKGDLTLPEMLSSLGDYAFDGCTGFDGTLSFTGSTRLGNYVFRNCGFTGPVDLSNVTSIGTGAFQNCSGFTGDLVFPSTLVSLGAYAFDGCSGFDGKLVLTNLQEGFKSGGITNVLGDYVFRKCSRLKGDLVIPDFITEIGRNTFDGCSGFDGELKLSNKLEYIDWIAFRNCSGLKGTLTFPETFTQFGDIGYGYYAIHAFNGCKGFTNIEFKSGKVNAIPESVFQNCTGLTGEIVLPTVTEQFIIDKNAFAGCSNITNVKFGNEITGLGESAFAGCTNMAIDFIIPQNITEIDKNCFNNSGLTGVVIPKMDNLKIGDGAFSDLNDCQWIISLNDEPTGSLGIDASTPVYVHSQVVEAYKQAFSIDNIYPILSVDDIEMEANRTAQITYKYQPESLSEETEAAILALSTAHKGEKIDWSTADITAELAKAANGSSVISVDPETLTVSALQAGSANIIANDGVNFTKATVTVNVPSQPDNKGCGCYEDGDENAKVRERIYMTPQEQKDLTSLLVVNDDTKSVLAAALTTLEAASWTTTNDEIVTISAEGSAEAMKFGEAYVRAKDAEGNTIAVIAVFVCPTVTVEHASGIIYAHHVIYNSRPTLYLASGGGLKITGVTHDGENITNEFIDNEGKYVSFKPITENSTINVSTERDLSNDPTTGAQSVWSDSNVRIYVDGHIVNITGVDQNTIVRMYNLAGTKLFDHTNYPDIDVKDSGIYIIEIDGEPVNFKILVR